MNRIHKLPIGSVKKRKSTVAGKMLLDSGVFYNPPPPSLSFPPLSICLSFFPSLSLFAFASCPLSVQSPFLVHSISPPHPPHESGKYNIYEQLSGINLLAANDTFGLSLLSARSELVRGTKFIRLKPKISLVTYLLFTTIATITTVGKSKIKQ